MNAKAFSSAIRLKEALTLAEIPHDWDEGSNDSLISRIRMEMTRKYLQESSYTAMAWFDADIEYTAEDVAKCWNLICMGADIAVGVYAMKVPGKDWYSAWVDGKLISNLDQFKEPMAVDYAGTGFMFIKRTALEKIVALLQRKHLIAKAVRESALHNKIDPPELYLSVLDEMVDAMAWSYEGPEGRSPALYTTPIYKDGFESEDYHFCRIAREAGLTITMDPNVRLKHWGQYPYGCKQEGA